MVARELGEWVGRRVLLAWLRAKRLGGASLLLSFKPAFGLAIIMPAITVITLFHLVLNPAGIAIAAVMDLTAATLAYAYRHQYAAMLA